MAYARRNYKKRKGAPRPYRRVYKKKGYQKKARKMTKMTNINKNLYYFKRKHIGDANSISAGSWTYTFQLDSVPNYTELTQLFDQYMIYGVKISWRLVLSPEAQAANISTYPNLYVRRDYDNPITETSNEIMQDNKCKRFILRPNKLVGIYVRPATLNIMSNGAATITSPQWKHWIDCTHADVSHYGVKVAMDTLGVNLDNFRVQTEYTYYIACKNTR